MQVTCTDCALRLFNNKCHNLQGIGNAWCNRVIIVPNVDYDAYKNKTMAYSSQVEVIQSHISSTGGLESLYVLPLIRCNEQIGCEINDDILSKCYKYLIEDFNVYKWKDVMLCGLAVNRILGVNIKDNLNNLFVNRYNGIRFAVNYNPLVKYINDRFYSDFVAQLERWYSCSINGFYDYNIIYL